MLSLLDNHRNNFSNWNRIIIKIKTTMTELTFKEKENIIKYNGYVTAQLVVRCVYKS